MLRRTSAALLLVTLVLQGCAVSRVRIQQADAILSAGADHRLDCPRADHCAIDSPLLDAATQALAASATGKPDNTVTLLNDSEPALAARVNLIRAARRSIDVQTYIWEQDDVGLLILQELIDAARRGVRVRILADQLSSFNDLQLLDGLARVHANFEVRLYNPILRNSQTSALAFATGLVCCYLKLNQRMHNKLMLVDDSIGITGGRNYQNRYFNWDNDYDYFDRDVMVGGAAASEMADSFNLFWNHPRAYPLTHLRDVNRRILADHQPPAWKPPSYRRPDRVAKLQREATDYAWLQQHLVEQTMHISDVDYYSDLPAKTKSPQRHEVLKLTAELMKMLSGAQSEIVLQTPYLVLSRRAENIFTRLHRQASAPRVIVSTNSLASTDDFVTYALAYKHRKRYLTEYGFNLYEMKPHASDALTAYALANGDGDVEGDENDDAGSVPVSTGPRHQQRMPVERPGLLGSGRQGGAPAPLLSTGLRVGLHAKSMVIDDDLSMIGSHNFDPRSDHYNTEGAVIIRDGDFARRLRQSILASTDPKNSWVIAPRKPTVPVLSKLNLMISSASEELPLFDLWPFRYATSYQMRAGCAPLLPDDPHFFTCYQPAGDFPDVALSPKLIYTHLVIAFGAGAKGVL